MKETPLSNCEKQCVVQAVKEGQVFSILFVSHQCPCFFLMFGLCLESGWETSVRAT